MTQTRVQILEGWVEPLTLDQALTRVRSFLQEQIPRQIVTLNSLMLYEAGKDPELARVLEEADMVLPDSSGILWSARKLGHPLPERIAGIDFLERLTAMAAQEGVPIALLGSAPGVATVAARRLESRFPGLKVAFAHHGYFSDSGEENIVSAVRTSGAKILFVGLQAARQEKWIWKNLQNLEVPIVMGVGGSFDVISDRLRRAPAWMQDAGIEWLYRLRLEPWRWRRVLRLPLFAARVLVSARTKKKILS